jgi:hypothetical protein
VATAVARVDNLEFLADVVPKTTTYREFRQKQKGIKGAEVGNGQRTMEEMTRGGRADLQQIEDERRVYDIVDEPDLRMTGQQVHAPQTNGHAYQEAREQASNSEPAHAREPNRGAVASARHDYDAVHVTGVQQQTAMQED